MSLQSPPSKIPPNGNAPPPLPLGRNRGIRRIRRIPSALSVGRRVHERGSQQRSDRLGRDGDKPRLRFGDRERGHQLFDPPVIVVVLHHHHFVLITLAFRAIVVVLLLILLLLLIPGMPFRLIRLRPLPLFPALEVVGGARFLPLLLPLLLRDERPLEAGEEGERTRSPPCGGLRRTGASFLRCNRSSRSISCARTRIQSDCSRRGPGFPPRSLVCCPARRLHLSVLNVSSTSHRRRYHSLACAEVIPGETRSRKLVPPAE